MNTDLEICVRILLIKIISPFVGVLLVIADGSLSAWLTLLARMCDFGIALLRYFKEVDCMKKYWQWWEKA